MEEAREESGRVTGKSNAVCRLLGKIPFRAVFRPRRRPRPERERKAEPWARIRDGKGSRTLVWGMGDGKTFGSVPLDPSIVFSIEEDGIRLQSATGNFVVVGSPGKEEANILLSRKIERSLRNRGNGFRSGVLGAGAFLLVLALLFVVTSGNGSGLGHFASLSSSLPVSGEGLPDSSFSPSSMSSGLTCHTH